MTKIFLSVKDRETNKYKGVLRILQFGEGKSHADYFSGIREGFTEFDGSVTPTVHGEFEGGEKVIEIALAMMDSLPGNNSISE